MWPMKLDMTLDECRGVLRRLELESYGTIISAFRAQGSLCKEKTRILEDLRRVLHISSDRHRAEARRVANDERLTTVAELVWGPNSSRDWCREGHRTFPILPRAVPHTALSYIANTVYEQLTRANCKLPHPAKTSCDRNSKAEEQYRFQLIKMEPKLAANGFVRDAAVVTSDPLQDIMSKSFIDTDLLLAEAKWKAKGQQEDTLQSGVVQNTDLPPPEMEDFNADVPSPCSLDDQPSLSDILLDTPKASAINGDSHRASGGKQSAKSSERARKTSHGGSGKRSLKVKSPYPASKPSKQARTNSLPSPHLIHSYAVPYEPALVPNGVAGDPPQLQQHLTSNMPYQPQQANHHGTASGQPHAKSQQYSSSSSPSMTSSTPHSSFTSPRATVQSTNTLSTQQSSASVASLHSSTYCQQREIYLPSSKKDIQHNISKLNPTNNLPATPVKGSGNSTVRSANREMYSKLPAHFSQPLLSYHKNSPSKNILIPTSAAAATLASLGLPRAPSVDHFNHFGSEEGTKTRDRVELSNERQQGKIHGQPDIPNPKIVFSSVPSNASAENHSNMGLQEANAPEERFDQSANSTVASSSHASNPSNPAPVKGSTAQSLHSNSSSDIKQTTNLVGFTSVKSARRISIQKVQLVPLVGADGTPASISTTSAGSASISKNNVFILPKSFPSGSVPGITPGQKIILPKNDTTPSPPTTGLQRSPPKVIVQPVPDVNSLVVLDDGLDRHQRQLFAGDESSNKPTKNSDSLVESENVQKLLSNMSGGSEGAPAPLRKITIASRQLVPFKGTLHGTVLPGTATIPGAKKLKLSNESSINTAADHAGSAGAQRAGGNTTGVDWEIEMDRSEDSRHRRVPSQKTNILVRNADAEIIGTSSRGQYSEAQMAPARLLPPTVSSSSSPVEAECAEYNVNSNERGDDSSATDSADAEEDPEDDNIRMEEEEEEDGIEDNDYDDTHTIEVDANTDDMVIEMDHNLDALIEEDPEGDIEAEEEQEVEVMNDEYGQAHELMAELDDASDQYIEEHPTTNGADVVLVPAAMNFEQCSDMIELAENGDDVHESVALEAKDDIVCELLEIDADGNHHTRQFSYEQAIAEGLTVLPRMAKVNPSVS